MTHAPCARCGQVHTRCTGHRAGDGRPCGRHPIHGATVCWSHGAAAPQVKAAAARRVEQARAERLVRREVARLGGRLDLDPIEVLELIWQGAAADVAALEAMIGSIEPAELHGPAGAALSSMLRDAREVARRAAKSALDAGVDERRVRVSEATIARLIAAVVGGLEDVTELPATVEEMRAVVPSAIGRRLRDESRATKVTPEPPT